MKKIFYSSGWLLLAGLLFALCALYALVQDTSLFQALFLWISVLLAIVLFRLLVVAVGELRGHPRLRQFMMNVQLSRKSFLLREHWRSGARTLKRLNRLGGHMPWFIFIGARNGKTTLLDSAQLSVLSHLDTRTRVAPTRTLKWWFFKQLCVLDVGSNFSTGSATSQRSWKRLVQWCTQVRAPEGVLVSISCSQLQAQSPAQRHEYGRHLRVQLEQLLKAYGRRLPLHIVVTGLDALPGFQSWQQTLTDEQREHALGYQWPRPPVVDRHSEFLEPLFDALAEGLLVQCLSTLDATLPSQATEQRLAFPEQVQMLKAGLSQFVVALCEPDSYHATGMLKGIWLTAAPGNAQGAERHQGHFIQDLLGQRLLHASQADTGTWLGQCPGLFRVPVATLAFALLAGALVWSGWQTYRLYSADPAAGLSTPAARLAQLDAGFARPLKHLPYLPLMSHWRTGLEQQLLKAQVWREHDHRVQLSHWQQQFEQGGASQKRQMILQLSAALLLQEAMIDRQPLSALEPLHLAPNRFLPLAVGSELDPTEALLLTRAWVRQSPGRIPLAQQRALLLAWVELDPNWGWLLEEREALTALRSAQFWPQWSVQTELSGLWTQDGERIVRKELELVSRALRSAGQPPLQVFWDSWHQRRQDAWLVFVGDTITQAHQQPGRMLASDESVALLNGQDSASRFIARLVGELSSVPGRESQQWLNEMRRVWLLQTQWQPANLQDQLLAWEKGLRGWFHRQLGNNQSEAYATLQDRQVWQAWKQSLISAVNITLRPADLARVTDGVFAPAASEGSATPNVLQDLQATFTQLMEQMTPPTQGQGSGAVWELLQAQVDALTANAVSVVACELERQWQDQVLQPLSDPRFKYNARRQEDMAWQLFQGFLNDKAQAYLVPGRSGISPKSWQASAIPFTAEFLHVLNVATSPQDLQRLPLREQTREQDELSALQTQLESLEQAQAAMKDEWTQTFVITQPATVPGGAALMPTGTKLRLSCGKQDTELSSANLREERMFRWAPGQCQGVSLTVVFPHGELKRELRGDDAWPRFLQELGQGERRYALDDFQSGDQTMFSLLGVDEILVRFAMQGHEVSLERWRAWESTMRAMNQTKAQVSALRGSTRQSGNYFTGNMTALPASAVQCRR